MPERLASWPASVEHAVCDKIQAECSLLRSLSFFCSLSQKRNIGGTKKERRKQLRKRRACLAKSRDPLLT